MSGKEYGNVQPCPLLVHCGSDLKLTGRALSTDLQGRAPCSCPNAWHARQSPLSRASERLCWILGEVLLKSRHGKAQLICIVAQALKLFAIGVSLSSVLRVCLPRAIQESS